MLATPRLGFRFAYTSSELRDRGNPREVSAWSVGVQAYPGRQGLDGKATVGLGIGVGRLIPDVCFSVKSPPLMPCATHRRTPSCSVREACHGRRDALGEREPERGRETEPERERERASRASRESFWADVPAATNSGLNIKSSIRLCLKSPAQDIASSTGSSGSSSRDGRRQAREDTRTCSPASDLRLVRSRTAAAAAAAAAPLQQQQPADHLFVSRGMEYAST